MIDIRKLQDLVRLMVENDLSELDLRDQDETVTIKRGPHGAPHVGGSGIPAPLVLSAAPAAASPPPTSHATAANGSATDTADAGLVPITSPMVGTFYSAPNPDSAPFVTAGARVGPDTVVCLIEAMKVFNEIKAEASGVIERVLVQAGTAVEFGQKLFLVRPA